MRIVIDMQGAQTASRYRGIGRYTMAFVRSVVSLRKDHEVFLALNGLFPETIEAVRAAFNDVLPQSQIQVWHAPGPVNAMQQDNAAKRVTAELIREAFLAQLKPDLIHICSLFEGYVDDAVVSLHQFDKTTPISVTFYDLIPHLHPAQYMEPNPAYALDYRRRLSQLQKASVCLAISDYSKQQALDNLPEMGGRVVAVSTAADAHFKVIDMTPGEAEGVRSHFGINHAFVMYTGGTDERKNLQRLLQAYAALPLPLRNQHQLLLAGKIDPVTIKKLRSKACELGLHTEELVFTGYINDEQLVQLYNLCQLFVFPSWEEGFGLPALEAMACGAVVIGANTSSLPEVIGLDAALFDPMDPHAITNKMMQGLEDAEFRANLKQHGLKQATHFSWSSVAQRTWTVWEKLHHDHDRKMRVMSNSKPRLAYVSPMPPERTGIADYSAELLPALAVHYDIELILDQAHPMTPLAGLKLPVRDADWLRMNADQYERVLYQMGNSPFHAYMLDLIEEVPGTVVLHDFFLSGLFSWLDKQNGQAQAWARALRSSHGYIAVKQRSAAPQDAYLEYPANWGVLQHAQGVIVHSNNSLQLIQRWYGHASLPEVAHIPLLRKAAAPLARKTARQQLGWSDDAFVVCSFGFLDSSKLNHLLLQCWLASSLAADPRCQLVFVGQNEGGEYGAGLLASIAQSGRQDQIRITGFSSAHQYNLHLAAADMAVQLRTRSRGETSAAALDCMNHALPMIVNANGAMGELDRHAVWVLPDEFEPQQLTGALEILFKSPDQRHAMGSLARQIIQTKHAPLTCAAQYAQAIEQFHISERLMPQALVPALIGRLPPSSSDEDLVALAQSLSRSFPSRRSSKMLYLDVTATCSHDLQTGIERVARSLLMELLKSPPEGYIAAPVYLCHQSGEWRYRRANLYTLSLLGCPTDQWEDDWIEPSNGDKILVLDLSGDRFVDAQQAGLFDHYRQQGATVHSVVYDLLPINMPEVFPPGADLAHAKWLKAISSLDGAACISRSVQADLALWQAQNVMAGPGRRPFHLSSFHLGADLEQSAPSRGVTQDAEHLLSQIRKRPSFLMVGTIEPRKNHQHVLAAFTQLWSQGVDANLVIVGREGWLGLSPSQRRNIPEVIDQLRHHPERQDHLFWPQEVSDELLTLIYKNCDCLIAASWGEGFGLPLIEAAHHGLPVLARDLPVFREVANDTATFFTADDPQGLAEAILQWLQKPTDRTMATPECTMTWQQSASQLTQVLWASKENQCTPR